MKSHELIEFINNCPKEIEKELKNRSFNYGEKLLVQNQGCDYIYLIKRKNKDISFRFYRSYIFRRY